MNGPEPTYESGAPGCAWIALWAFFCAILIFTASLLIHRGCVRTEPEHQVVFHNATDSVMIIDIQRHPSGFHLQPGEKYTRRATDILGRVYAAHTPSRCYLQMGIIQEFNTLTKTDQ